MSSTSNNLPQKYLFMLILIVVNPGISVFHLRPGHDYYIIYIYIYIYLVYIYISGIPVASKI